MTVPKFDPLWTLVGFAAAVVLQYVLLLLAHLSKWCLERAAQIDGGRP